MRTTTVEKSVAEMSIPNTPEAFTDSDNEQFTPRQNITAISNYRLVGEPVGLAIKKVKDVAAALMKVAAKSLNEIARRFKYRR